MNKNFRQKGEEREEEKRREKTCVNNWLGWEGGMDWLQAQRVYKGTREWCGKQNDPLPQPKMHTS